MSPPPESIALAGAHRTRQQTLAALAVSEARRLWATLSPANWRRSWPRVAPALTAMVTAAQTEAARGAEDYVATQMILQGVEPDPAATVSLRAFSGVASDGRALDGLIGSPIFEVRTFVERGMKPRDALAIGSRHMDRIVATQVQDSARVSTGVAITNDRKVRGYIRQLTPPSCSRCVILAGRWYPYSAGFLRHPQCDCVQMPSAEVIEPQNPRDIYDGMTPQQRKASGWSKADQQAIADGADLARATNYRRSLSSMQVAGQQLQTTLTAARGGGRSRRRGGRLTPESIYSEAQRLGWSRDEIIRQLKNHGYIL